MKTMQFLLVGALACSALLLSACTHKSPSSTGSEEDAQDNFVPSKELSANYTLLDLFYIYGHARNEIEGSVDAYVGKGSALDSKNAFGEKSCTKGYYDVCYMYNQMTDPYTRYYDPTMAAAMLASLVESEKGLRIVGIESAPYDEFDVELFVVTSADEGARNLGIQEGDLYSMDDLMMAYEEYSGQDTIKLDIARPLQNQLYLVTVKVAVEEIGRLPTVYLHYEQDGMGDSIPVIRITEFDSKTLDDSGTYGEFAEALKKTAGSKATIIDLRNNGGGDTDHCIAAAEQFLSKGDTIVIDIIADADSVLADGRQKYIQKLDTVIVVAGQDGSARDRYVVMLANEMSASCAELMLSAIASNKKSPVVGALTYGKQIAQLGIAKGEENEDIPIALPDGLAIITAMYSYDKDWKLYHDLGIVPDFEIKTRKAQMEKAVELASSATYRRTAGYGTERLGHFAKPAVQTRGRSPLKAMKMRYKIIR